MESGSQQQRKFVRKSKVVKVVSEDSWNSLIAQATNRGCPVVVHFTASWCVPSLAMNRFFEELAQNYENCLFLSVDVDDVKEVAAKWGIKAMPTFVMMKYGAEADKLVGANPIQLRKGIEGLIHSTASSNAEK